MKWYRNYLMFASAALVALFAIGWTQNSTSDWFKGVIYAGSAKLQLTDSTGNLLIGGSGNVTGNLNVVGTLAVTGATTLKSALAVTSAITASSGATVAGNVAVAGTLAVTGATTLTGAVTASSGATVAGTLTNSGGPPVITTVESGLTAHAGGTQALALMLSSSKFMHVVGTVGTAADSVALPTGPTGQCHLVVNEAAANSMQLFGVTGVTINSVAQGTGIAVAAKKAELCCMTGSGDYACAGP